jgi:hypothetical protein
MQAAPLPGGTGFARFNMRRYDAGSAFDEGEGMRIILTFNGVRLTLIRVA